ncbi:MAG: phosphoribosylanthranilate isomerase [Candidatus Omnitrophota bacterium]|nr:phosphoribosylanthranilate isomerase [Candidatus Omnitrophota bacterium]
MVRVKICGITNLEDALVSVNCGCDALGFVFYKKSPRYIEPDKARAIIKQLPKNIIKIGIFVNEKEKEIKKAAKLCSLDMLQFHGDELPCFCKRFKDYKVIKAFRISSRTKDNIKQAKFSIDKAVKYKVEKVLKYKTFAYLFDAFVPSKRGGTGKTFDWRLLRGIDKTNRPVFLSGGLSAKNAREAIKIVRPQWLDASSSLEIRPGKKDSNKVKEFIDAVKNG